MARYAEGTTVAPEKTEAEIKALLRKRGADEIWSGMSTEAALVGFAMQGRRVRFTIKLPAVTDPRFRGASNREKARDAEVRRLWRALLLSIKARLEVVDSGIEQFESAFLAHIVTPDDRTVYESAAPVLEAAYASGKMPRSLLALPAPREE